MSLRKKVTIFIPLCFPDQTGVEGNSPQRWQGRLRIVCKKDQGKGSGRNVNL